MTSLMKGDKVVRETGCNSVTHLYGEVIFWGSSKNGRLMVVCEAPDGAIFVSDPSHLEKINEQTSSPKERTDYNRVNERNSS